MKADSVKQRKSLEVEAYRNIISGIEFMEKFIEKQDIFSPSSPEFNNFLIQSFSYLHSDFHYLSFTNQEDLDLELVKAARILQILPVNNVKKLFDNMCESDIKKFWDKFFSLFKNKKLNNFRTDSIFSLSWENKINFFKEMKSTLNYLNYEFPVVSSKKLAISTVINELDNWKELTAKWNENENDLEESLNSDKEQMAEIDTEKLIIDAKQVVSVYINLKQIKKQNEPEYLDFFEKFIYLTKNILKYRKNIGIITSTVLDDLNCKMLLNNVNLSDNMYFMKRCNKFINDIKSKQHYSFKF